MTVGGIRRDRLRSILLRQHPCLPPVPVLGCDLAGDVRQGDIAHLLDEIVDGCLLGLLPGVSLGLGLVVLVVEGDLRHIKLEGFRHSGLVDRFRHAAKQGLGLGFAWCLSKISGFEPGHDLFDVGQRGNFFDRAINEALRQSTRDSCPVPMIGRFPDTALGIATDKFQRPGIPEGSIRLCQRIAAHHGHFKGLRAQCDLDEPTLIDTCEARRDPSLIVPPAAAFLQISCSVTCMSHRDL